MPVILPIELVDYIMAFMPVKPPHFKCMDHIIRTYHEDHDLYAHKRGAMFYCIKNLLSFSEYYFDTKINEDYVLGKKYYNDFTKELPPYSNEYEEWRQD